MKENRERNDEKMKRKNGFTLIELLAVIVILAIIALIAVPVVMNIINRANKSAFKDSAYGILKAGELFYTDQLLENAGLMIDKTFNFPDDIDGLEFKGSKPSDGTMTIRKDGKVSMAITNGKYCVTKGFEDDDVTITDDNGTCELGSKVNKLSDLATTGTFLIGTSTSTPIEEVHGCSKSGICEPGTPFAIKVNESETYKFYVLSDTGKEVTLIMDRNLYSQEDLENSTHNVSWVSKADYNDDTNYGDSGNTNKGPLTALKVLKERTSSWTNIPEYSYTLKNEIFPEDGEYTYPDVTGELATNVRARLPRREEVTTVETGCTTSSNSCKSWLYENLKNTGGADNIEGYWTSTVNSTDSYRAWFVSYYGRAETQAVFYHSDYWGLRPVITLSK